MECLECFKDFRLLGNHVWQAHGIKCRDYKIKHNIPITTPLADESWVEMMKDIGRERKETKEGNAHIEKLVSCGKKYQVCISLGLVPPPAAKRKAWPKCSQEKVQNIGGEKRKEDCEAKFNDTKAAWESGVPVRSLPVSPAIAARWAREGRLPPRKMGRWAKR